MAFCLNFFNKKEQLLLMYHIQPLIKKYKFFKELLLLIIENKLDYKSYFKEQQYIKNPTTLEK